MRSCSEAFIEPNTIAQSDVDFDAQFGNNDLFYFEIMRMDVLFFYLVAPHAHAQTIDGRPYDRSNLRPALN